MARVFLMENHDEAYRVWRDQGVKKKILIHIDAHHDMWWIPEKTPTTIANFICPSLREDMVREVFWVVPDQTWELPRSRKAVLRHLGEIAAKYPESRRTTRIGDRQISAVIFGKPVTVCSVDSLPPIDEGVILDIDVDYLVIPYVSYGEGDKYGVLPWRWPEELVAGLRARDIRADLVTIAYSVEGGYTPLKWKYLGNELAELLRQSQSTGSILRGMRLIREGAVAANYGDFDLAEEKYHEATEVLPDFAASHYHLAHLYIDMNRVEDGKRSYRQAVALDPSYQTTFNTAGLLHQSDGRFQAVEREMLRALRLDPQDAYAHYGLGWIAAQRKQWSEAESQLRKSVALDHDLIDAHRVLGDVLLKQGRCDEAISAYESSMKLALAGHKPLDGLIITNEQDDRRLKDPHHFRIHARLARLYELKGATERAINGYRMSIAGGYHAIPVRARLAYLYFKQSQWRQAAKEVWQAVKLIPGELRRVFFRTFWNLRRNISGGRRLAFLSPVHRAE